MSPIIKRDCTFVERLRQLAVPNKKVELTLKSETGPGAYTGIIKDCGVDYIEIEFKTTTEIPYINGEGEKITTTCTYNIITIIRFEDIKAYSILEDITNI